MKILITGGAGFIGSNLCIRLIAEGHNITVIDTLLRQVHGEEPDIDSPTYNLIKDKVRFIWGDASDYFTWSEVENEDFDCIICLAAETGTGQSMFAAHKYCVSNINSIAELNDMTLRKNYSIFPGKVILASSRAVYGDASLDSHDNPIAAKETDVLNPKSIYAITKMTQEQLLFAGFGNIPVCALRFQNVYGPGQSLKNPYTGILSIFSTAIKNGRDIQVFDDGLMSRDFVYIDDVVDSIILCMKKDEANGQVFNVGSGVRTTVLEVAQTLKEKYKSEIKIHVTGEKMKGDIRHNFADISKIQKIGFEPKVDFKTGIQKFVDWVESSGDIKYNDYENSIEELRKNGILTNKK
jgi:dTDP-L-rhamnose 4-epimerase